MRSRLVGGSLFVVALLVPVALLASGCANSDSATSGAEAEGGPSDPGNTLPDGGKTDGTTGGDSGKPVPKNDCKLDELTGVADVTPSFTTHEPPATAPPAMTGGTLNGSYRVDKALVFLPSQTKGLADPKKSTGTINAWAVFNGTNYRLYLKADFTIVSVLGPQSQGSKVSSQGGFTVSNSALAIDHACDAEVPTEADYTYTDNGSGRATILIKQTTTYGDTYLQLDAAKN